MRCNCWDICVRMNGFWPQGRDSGAPSSGRSSSEGADLCVPLRRVVFNLGLQICLLLVGVRMGALIAVLGSVAPPLTGKDGIESGKWAGVASAVLWNMSILILCFSREFMVKWFQSFCIFFPIGQPASFPLRGQGSDVTPPPPLWEGLPGTLGAERHPSYRPPQWRSQSQLCLCRCQWQQPSRAPSPSSHPVPPPDSSHSCRDNIKRRHSSQARHHGSRIGGAGFGQGKDAVQKEDRVTWLPVTSVENISLRLCRSAATI